MNSSDHPYQLALVAGEAHTVARQLAPIVVDVTGDLDDPLAGLRRSGLTASDVRSRVVLCTTDAFPGLLALYAGLSGFVGRLVDVHVNGSLFEPGSLFHQAQRSADSGRPAERIDVVQVGAAHDTIPSFGIGEVDPTTGIDPDVAAKVRFARRARIVSHGHPFADLAVFASVAGLRARNGRDRYPQLCEGTEPGDVVEDAGCDLDDLRQAGVRHRRAARTYELVAVPVASPSRRSRRLSAAAEVPVSSVLAALGSVEVNGLWNCPRPQNHTHGDATPSSKVYDDNRFRCHRCDAEPIDTLRLLAVTCEMTADEAANLATDLTLLAPHRDRIVAERAERSGTAAEPASAGTTDGDGPAPEEATGTEPGADQRSGGQPGSDRSDAAPAVGPAGGGTGPADPASEGTSPVGVPTQAPAWPTAPPAEAAPAPVTHAPAWPTAPPDAG